MHFTTKQSKYTLRSAQCKAQQRCNQREVPLFENLISAKEADYVPSAFPPDAEFIPDGEATPAQIIDGKVKTSAWLDSLGLEDDAAITSATQETARTAFVALTAPLNSEAQRNAVAKLDVPVAVQHLVGMLTAYDWAFVDQAKELRGYCIAQLLEESKHPDAKYRLRAIELIGKVTEVALFTERVEVKKAQLSDVELEDQIKARMEKYMGLIKVVEEEPDATDA